MTITSPKAIAMLPAARYNEVWHMGVYSHDDSARMAMIAVPVLIWGMPSAEIIETCGARHGPQEF